MNDTNHALVGTRKKFAYKIQIKDIEMGRERKMVVEVYHIPDGDTPDQSVSLLKVGKEYPLFESF